MYRCLTLICAAGFCFARCGIPPAWGATTDLANIPLQTYANQAAHTNILFILNDSSSMNLDYLPDDAPAAGSYYGYRASQCNGLAYDPLSSYAPPLKYDGSPYPAAIYPKALSDGYNTGSAVTDLSISPYNYYYGYSGNQGKLSYLHGAADSLNTSTTFYRECSTPSSATSAVFTKVDINTQSAFQQQNYANWFAYYHTRLLAMKTAVGLAFSDLDAQYRVGYTVSNNKTTDPSATHSSSGTQFLSPAEFDRATAAPTPISQKQAFYDRLYATRATASAPLRGALAQAGQFFAHKAKGQTADPMQYSCQRNFTLLATDVPWNTEAESTLAPKFGPYSLDDISLVGQQDGANTPRPFFDGGSSGGSADSLADVAMYYYLTDLRDASLGNCTGVTGRNVCENNVLGSARDSASHQHMSTFAVALGDVGTLAFDPNYLSQSTGDYADISQAVKNWPTPGPGGKAVNRDDLWHAAVNGRGEFFNASEPVALRTNLKRALNSIKATTGAASAATTSLQPVQGNSAIYIAQFTTSHWYGDVLSYPLDLDTGIVNTTKPTWSAQAMLDAADATRRTIYYPKSGALHTFTYRNLSADSLQDNFDNFCNKSGAGQAPSPTQCGTASDTTKSLANSGANLVDYLRGAKTYANDLIFRHREHLLGDMVNASPLYVGQPSFRYRENSYPAFMASQRHAMVYAAANDGMLHALDSATGVEKWAYIPSFVMPSMYKLADSNYANQHINLVDGTPVAGDIHVNSAWKTIVVGGLNAGGRGYYALDITSPENPKFLWEFSDVDLGYSFGNPLITKLANGSWVVIVASGYNNVGPGDGNGHLYVLDANTGIRLLKIATQLAGAAVGNASTPSGLAQINNYVNSDVDNTTQVVYGGDLLGNVWRFDINGQIQPYLASQRLALLSVGGRAQPITTRPALAELNYQGKPYKVLYLGTGKYLGGSDVGNTDRQTLYALKDNGDSRDWGDVRTASNPAMVVQTAATASAKPVDWATTIGWYRDLTGTGERVNTNPVLVQNTLYVSTNSPGSEACSAGGSSWLYTLAPANGGAPSSASDAALAVSLGAALQTGTQAIRLSNQTLATVVTRSDGKLITLVTAQPAKNGPRRRTSWRILN